MHSEFYNKTLHLFDEAQEAFFDPNAVEFYDPDHPSQAEKRKFFCVLTFASYVL